MTLPGLAENVAGFDFWTVGAGEEFFGFALLAGAALVGRPRPSA